MKPIPLFAKTDGLNTTLPPTSLNHNPESGEVELAVAVNVDIHPSGKQISRRKGYALLQAGSFHSGFCRGGDALVVKELSTSASLYRFNSDSTLTGIRSGLSQNKRMSYTQDGNLIFYSNGFENGIYQDGASTAWEVSDYVGYPTDKEFDTPPLGRFLEIFSGYMLLAIGPWLFHSEPFNFSIFYLGENYISLTDNVTMVKGVDDGIWVGTTKSLFFLDGLEPSQWKVSRKVGIGIAEYSVCLDPIEAIDLGLNLNGKGYLAITQSNNSGTVVWLGPSAQFFDLTSFKLDPTQLSGNKGSCVHTKDRLIATLEP